MSCTRRTTLLAVVLLSFCRGAYAEVLLIDAPMAPPAWALMQRELLRSQAAACQEFFAKYFDERGHLLCVERWGGDDGPDDAIENVTHWPILYALGADPAVLAMYHKAWEGHLRQYTKAKTTDVPFARDGMYYKEFPCKMDWLHNGEGLTPFAQQPAADPNDTGLRRRLRRFSGFYIGEEATARNYDREHKILRSMFTGSRGPLLRKATGLDWAGDPIEVEGRFLPLHGEESYAQMVEHFKDYNDVVGDHPQNLGATILPALAFMLDHDEKYRQWVVEYVDAWLRRIDENNGIIPSNIGLDGTIGGNAGGKWYGGVYGWGFTVAVPGSDQVANRNTVGWGILGFVNAFMLTGDVKYLRGWADMIDTINSHAQVVDGKKMYPTMYGDDGWYAWTETPWSAGALEVYFLTMAPEDRARLGPAPGPWIAFLEGNDAAYPERSLAGDFEAVRARIEGMRNDSTTPDTRLSDDPMGYNPAVVRNLCRQMWGGLPPGRRAELLLTRLRYFDPDQRRPGMPPDVAALVTRIEEQETEVVLVNVSPIHARTVVVQGGAYGEHRCGSVRLGDSAQEHVVDASHFTVRLAPGCGAKVTISMTRNSEQPRIALPWD